MKKELVYYKVKHDSAGTDLNHYLKEKCFDDKKTAIEYVESCLAKYLPYHLNPKERKVIYECTKTIPMLGEYVHQIVSTWNDGLATTITVRVYKHRVIINDSAEI